MESNKMKSHISFIHIVHCPVKRNICIHLKFQNIINLIKLYVLLNYFKTQ